MKHKVVRVNDLMYKGCEPHWKCLVCNKCVPFHCYTKEQYEQEECDITYQFRSSCQETGELKECSSLSTLLKTLRYINDDNSLYAIPTANAIQKRIEQAGVCIVTVQECGELQHWYFEQQPFAPGYSIFEKGGSKK